MRQWIRRHRGLVLGLGAGTLTLFGWLVTRWLDFWYVVGMPDTIEIIIIGTEA